MQDHLTTATRKRSVPTADRNNSLGRYFQEMSTGGLLDADGEATLAENLRAREEAVWVALLTHAPLVASIAKYIEAHAEGGKDLPLRALKAASTRLAKTRSKASRESLARAAEKLAATLREIDPDQDLLKALLSELDALMAGNESELVLTGNAARLEGLIALRSCLDALRFAANQTRNSFVESNLGLVVSVARRYQFSGMGLADLIQEGNLGLLKAVARFDERRGFRFSTYATWWIRHAIGRAVADKSRTVRVPVHVTEASQKIRKTSQELSLQLGREATRQEVATAVGMSVSKLDKTMQRAHGHSLSLDETLSEDSDRERLEVFTTDESDSAFDQISAIALADRATKALETLAPLEIEILNRRFGLAGKTATTLQDIANTIGKSRERIRQIQENALSKLRETLIAEHAV